MVEWIAIGVLVVLYSVFLLFLYGMCRLAGTASRAEEARADARCFQVIQGGKSPRR